MLSRDFLGQGQFVGDHSHSVMSGMREKRFYRAEQALSFSHAIPPSYFFPSSVATTVSSSVLFSVKTNE
jgi:hypothetical protein